MLLTVKIVAGGEESASLPFACCLLPCGAAALCYAGVNRRYRLRVRTEPSQGSNTGSIPVSATTPGGTFQHEVWQIRLRGAARENASVTFSVQ